MATSCRNPRAPSRDPRNTVAIPPEAIFRMGSWRWRTGGDVARVYEL
jgi:hypothetical protein